MPSILYHSGAILTMEGNDPRYAEALVVTDGVISHVGSRAGAEELRPVRSVDLAGKALLPGFIDAHGHPQSALALIDALVNRTSGSVAVHAPEQAVSVYEALRSITTTAAYQNFEDDQKGTLSVGKRADLVILDRDPLAVNPAELLLLRVVETIKDGRTIFAA